MHERYGNNVMERDCDEIFAAGFELVMLQIHDIYLEPKSCKETPAEIFLN